MRRIYKWPLMPTTQVPWSPGDRVLMIANQNGTPTLWAEQEDGAPPSSQRGIAVVGTGFEAPSGLEHIGSAVCGEFVWHVYAEPVERPF